MLRNYLVIAVRNLLRHRLTSLLNICGLALGLACCILILQWVRFELSWDSFHEHLDDLFIITTTIDHGSDQDVFYGAPPALGPILTGEQPEVMEVSRCKRRACTLRYGEQIVAQDLGDSRFVDPSFLNLLSFPLLRGDRATALADPHSIVLCRSLAARLFGDEDPIGKTVTLDYRHDLQVTAILDDVPRASTLQFESLMHIDWIAELSNQHEPIDVWYNPTFFTVLRLHPEADPAELAARIRERALSELPEIRQILSVFPFADLNLYSIDGQGGYIETVVMVCTIAALVLLIACINFMNLATARAGSRAKEVGIRKVAGARRGELILQFYLEALLQSFLAQGLGLVIAEQLLPLFRARTNYPIQLDYSGDPGLWIALLAMTILTGLIAGTYPALVLSSFRPVAALSGPLPGDVRGVWFRRVLVVLQFGAATVLIIGTVVVYAQFDYLQSRDTGFNTDNLLSFPLGKDLQPRFETLKQRLLQYPGVTHVTRTGYPPVFAEWTSTQWRWEGKDPAVDHLVTVNAVGPDWLQTLGLEMVEGRFFATQGDPAGAVVINQAFADLIGGGGVVGRWLENPHEAGSFFVIGVVEDFHFASMFRRLGPLLLTCDPFEDHGQWYAMLRLRPDGLGETLAQVEETVAELGPDRLFEWSFLAESLQRRYRSIRFRGDLLRDFAVVAVLISCLGLLGLALFLTEKRSKEIGVRKVVGASAAGVAMLLVREFLRWVVIANLIAWPVAALLLRRWLDRFPYRVDLEPVVFLSTAVATCLVAAVTVGVRAVQAALANPIDAIRFE